MRFSLFLLFLSHLGIAQPSDFKFHAKPDSIISKTEHGYIYITSDTTSDYYRWIVPDLNEREQPEIYSEYIQIIKDVYKQPVQQFELRELPRKWNTVYMYKEEYVIYAPSDWMYNHGYLITDSVVYITGSDPSNLYVITEYKRTGNQQAEFTMFDASGDLCKIKIVPFEKDTGIYEWIIINSDGTYKFLMQDSDYVKKLRMIACDCGDQKCIMEFDWNK